MKYAVGNRVSVEVSKGRPVVGEVVNCIPGSADEQPMYDVCVPQVVYTHGSPTGTCTGATRTLAFFEDEMKPAGDTVEQQ